MATERVIIQVSETGTRRVQRNIAAVGNTARGAGNNVDILRRALGGLGGALVLRQAVRTLADFGQEMSTVRAITEATDTQFAALRKTARDLGATTRFSATQAAEGMTFLARAGFEVDQVLASIDDTLLLAQAGALALGRAADIASNVLTGFRLEADQAGRVVDVLAKAANSANTDVNQLGEGLKLVAPVAAGLGVSLEETVSAVAQLSNAGLQATVAGTGLRKVIATLESPTGKAKQILEELGLTAGDVRVSSVGLTEALRRLNDAGLQAGDALEFFGLRGGPAAEVLLRITDQTDEFTGGLRQVDGFARRVARTMDDNLNGALLAVRSAFEAVILSVGELGGNTLITRTLREIASGLRFIADNSEVLAAILGALAAVTIPALVTSLSKITPFFLTGGPFGLALAAVGALAGAFFSLGGKVAEARSIIGKELGQMARDVRTLAGEIFGEIATIAKENFDKVGITAKDALTFIARLFDALKGVAVGTLAGIIAVFEELPKEMARIAGQAKNAILDSFNPLRNDLQKIQDQAAVDFAQRMGVRIPEELANELRANGIEVQGAGTDLGQLFALAFEKGLESSTTGRDLLDQINAVRTPGEGPPTDAGGAGAGGAARPPGADPATLNQGTQAVSAQAAAIAALNEQLAKERELAGLTEEQRQISLASLEIQNQLREAGVDVENRFVQAQLAAAEAQLRDIQEIQKKSQVLEEIKAPEEERLERLRLLNELLAEGKINQEEFNQAVQGLGRAASGATTFADSLKNKFLAVDTSVEKLAGSIGDLLLNAIDRSADALAEFAVDGFQDTEKLKEAFSSLLRDLAKGIIKLIIQTLILAAIRKALGAPAFGAPTSVDALPTAQLGGPVDAGQPTIVGETGKELFVPPTRGNIIPASQVQDRQQVNLTVVNTQDPDEIPNFFSTSEGDEVFLNTFGRNARKVQSMLGIGV